VLARANDPDRGCPVALVLRSAREEWNQLDSGLAAEFQRVAAALGRPLLAVGAGSHSPAAIVEQLLTARAWGAVLSTIEPETIALVKRAGLPAVVAENWTPGGELDTVCQDDFRGSMAAAIHLAGRGHEAIAWFGSAMQRNNMHTAGRFAGAVAGLAVTGKRLRPELTVETAALDIDELTEEACRLLSRPDRPSAVLAMWQDKTEALARAAAKLGLVPGKDFEMVGWVTDEGYESFYVPKFRRGPVPPAVTWSRALLARTALAQLEQRRAHPELPPMHLSIPTGLRFDGATGRGEQK
jgi:DNA-binding LacI/PurR family transcriptional regulator